MVVAAWLVAVLPIVVATARGLARGWMPIGDNALMVIRARDVLTSHHPLLGTWSSASLASGVDLNHPGPLLFDAFAPTVRLFGGRAGVAIGAALVNVVAVAVVAWFAHRRGGRAAALLALVAVVALEFTMGSDLLFDPWNPHVLMLPSLALLFAAWGVAAADRWALPAYLAIGSFCLQGHLGYAYLVPSLLVGAYAVAWLAQPVERVSLRPGRAPLVTSAVVVVVLWAQPLWEQFTGAGEGNLSRILGARGSGGPAIGAGLSLRSVAAVTTAPPWSWRGGFVGAIPPTAYTSPGVLGPVDTVPLGWAVLRLGLLVAAVVALAVLVWRARDRAPFAALGIVAVTLAVALLSLAITPIGPIGLTPHQVRWLWPVATFAWFAVGFAALRLLATRDLWRSQRTRLLAAGGVALVLGAVLTFPRYVQDTGLPPYVDAQAPVVRELDGQLGALEGIGTVWYSAEGLPYNDNYAVSVLAELQRRGIPFVVDLPGFVRQFGDDREYRGDADVKMVLRWGPDALETPDGWDRVALVVPDDDPLKAVGVFIRPVD